MLLGMLVGTIFLIHLVRVITGARYHGRWGYRRWSYPDDRLAWYFEDDDWTGPWDAPPRRAKPFLPPAASLAPSPVRPSEVVATSTIDQAMDQLVVAIVRTTDASEAQEKAIRDVVTRLMAEDVIGDASRSIAGALLEVREILDDDQRRRLADAIASRGG
jgi:hypothetical protein